MPVPDCRFVLMGNRVSLNSGSPISIFNIGELRKTLGVSSMKLEALATEDKIFSVLRENKLRLRGLMQFNLESNGWSRRKDKNHRRKLTVHHWTRFDCAPGATTGPVKTRGSFHGHQRVAKRGSGQEVAFDKLQKYFGKQFSIIFHRVGKTGFMICKLFFLKT